MNHGRNPRGQQDRSEIKELLPHALPRDTRARLPFAWQATFSKELKTIQLVENRDDLDRCSLSPVLILDNYLPRLDKLGKINGKGHLALGIARYFDQHADRYQQILQECRIRQLSLLEALKIRDQDVEYDTVRATVVWRMVVGIGRPHVWGNALALHPLYGFPYIPGSSVKGLVHLAAFWKIADDLACIPGEPLDGSNETRLQCLDRCLCKVTDKAAWQARFPALTDAIFEKISRVQGLFGTVGKKGRGLFFDALPEVFPRIEADIMNPHFQEYYQQGPKGTQPPSDDLKPNPIFFLTVGKSTVFRFPLAVLPGEANVGPLLAYARTWLKRTVEEFGVGAKTRAGYGELKVNESSSQRPIQKQKQ